MLINYAWRINPLAIEISVNLASFTYVYTYMCVLYDAEYEVYMVAIVQ